MSPIGGGVPLTNQQLRAFPVPVLNLGSPTFSIGLFNVVPALLCTDLITIQGAVGKVIRLSRVELTGTQQSAGLLDVRLVKRSTLNSGGTFTNPTIIPHDPLGLAPTAIVTAYSANPTTLGNEVGVARASKIFLPTPGLNTDSQGLHWQFTGATDTIPIFARGANDVLAVSLGGITVPGGLFSINLTWSEVFG